MLRATPSNPYISPNNRDAVHEVPIGEQRLCPLAVAFTLSQGNRAAVSAFLIQFLLSQDEPAESLSLCMYVQRAINAIGLLLLVLVSLA